jgi:hypothetical protein
VGILPFAIDDPERDIFVRWASREMKEYRIFVSRLFDDLVSGRFTFVDEIRVENVEFIPLNNLWWRVVGAARAS